MKRIKVMLAVLVTGSALALTGCAGTPGAEEVPGCTTAGLDNGSGCPVTVQYEGKTLHCLSWDGSQDEHGLTCDFVRYWKENPR